HSDSMVLTPDDVGGICAIYAADGTRNTSAGAVPQGACDPTARHGFSTECGSLHPNPPPTDNATGSGGGGCAVVRHRAAGGSGLAALVMAALAFVRLRRPRRLN